MKILVLYTRLTGYWLSCMRYDHHTKGNSYLVVRKNPDKDAPFQIKSEKGIDIVDGDNFSSEDIQALADKFQPELVYVSGWTDKRFLKIARCFKKRSIPVITGMDNHWRGSLRQHISSLLSPILIRRFFTHIWVPGEPQYQFAMKLGFSPDHILTGLYCADINLFGNISQTNYNKQLVFVGRLVEHKGLKVFFSVLNQMIDENKLKFKVHIIGNGTLRQEIPAHPKIKHTPFVKPEKLPNLLENAGYFILPSLYEAWVVVVHEATLAGLPIITTKQCGAASAFVKNGYNGFLYEANAKDQLKKILLHVMSLSEAEYFMMSKGSKELASKINFNSWSATINAVLKQN